MQSRINKLLEQVSDDDRVELVMLNNGYVSAMKENKEKPSSQAMRNWRTIKADLVTFLDELEEKYNPAPTSTQGPTWQTYTETKVKADVLTYLQETGWEVKKQTFYNHCSDGKLKKGRRGLFTRGAVKKYAETWLVHGGLGSTVEEASENLFRDKTMAEIKRIKTSAEHDRLKLEILQGKHIERAKMEFELAARAVVLDSGLEYLFKTMLVEMVAVVGGDQNKGPLLLELLLRKKDEQLALYANFDDFSVIFTEE